MNKEDVDFDDWNDLKKNIERVANSALFHEREIWWCSLGINLGVETDGKHERYERPVLIIRKFNRDVAWVLPMTSKVKESPFHHSFEMGNKKRSVMLTQLKTISTKRLSRKIGMMRMDAFLEVKIKTAMHLLKNETPSFDEESRRPKP